MKATLRPTVAADFIALQGKLPPYRTRCITAVLGDQVIGIGGLVFYPGGTVAVSALIKEELRRRPVTLHRAGLRVMADAEQLGIAEIVGEPQPDNPAAERWMERCGFTRVEVEGRPIFFWRRGR